MSLNWNILLLGICILVKLSGAQRNVTIFTLIHQDVSWNDAYQGCKDRGGHLAQLVDQPTNNAVAKHIREVYNDSSIARGFNIGLTEVIADFKWMPGCGNVTWENWDPDIQFYNSQKCGKLHSTNLLWRKATCYGKRRSICQYNTDTRCPYGMHQNMSVTTSDSIKLKVNVKTGVVNCTAMCTNDTDCWAFQMDHLQDLCSLYETQAPENITYNLEVNSTTITFVKLCFQFEVGEPWNQTTSQVDSIEALVESCNETSTTSAATNWSTAGISSNDSTTNFATNHSTTNTTTNPSTINITTNPSTNNTITNQSTLNAANNPSTNHTTTNPSIVNATVNISIINTTTNPSTINPSTNPSTNNTDTNQSPINTTANPSATNTPTNPSANNTDTNQSPINTTTDPSTNHTTTDPSTNNATTSPSTNNTTTDPSTNNTTTNPSTNITTTDPSTDNTTTDPSTINTTANPSAINATTHPSTIGAGTHPSTIDAGTNPSAPTATTNNQAYTTIEVTNQSITNNQLATNTATNQSTTPMPTTADTGVRLTTTILSKISTELVQHVLSTSTTPYFRHTSTRSTITHEEPADTTVTHSPRLTEHLLEPTPKITNVYYLPNTTTSTLSTFSVDLEFNTSSGLMQCPCFCFSPKLPKDERDLFIGQLLAGLTVKKTSLSSQRRKYESVPDNRPVAVGVGYAGVVILLTTFCLFLLSDILTFLTLQPRYHHSQPV